MSITRSERVKRGPPYNVRPYHQIGWQSLSSDRAVWWMTNRWMCVWERKRLSEVLGSREDLSPICGHRQEGTCWWSCLPYSSIDRCYDGLACILWYTVCTYPHTPPQFLLCSVSEHTVLVLFCCLKVSATLTQSWNEPRLYQLCIKFYNLNCLLCHSRI